MKTTIALFFTVFLFQLFAFERGVIQSNNDEIEFFFEKPDGDGPFPVIFLIHGYQPPDTSTGGMDLVESFIPFTSQNIMPISISLPGFGKSGGKRDFAGPISQQAVLDVVEYFETLSYVNCEKIALYGGGLGSIVAAMISAKRDFSFQILQSGAYDLSLWFAELPEYLAGIKNNFVNETDATDEAIDLRSPLRYVDRINTPTLILHSKLNDRRGLDSANLLQKKLSENGIESRLAIFSTASKGLGKKKWDVIMPYVREHFFHLFGVGLRITDPFPAIMIHKILPNSPAEKNGKIYPGDVILSISPNNDEFEICALRMPLKEFVPLLIGEKGTSVRLRVQHLDDSFEDIVLERDSY